MRFLSRRIGLGLADYAVTMPLVRWIWTGPTHTEWASALGEFRPTDRETVLEMMAGRYLLSSKLVDTHGVSPFGIEADSDEWHDELHSFSWLRHFRDARDEGERRFARTLVLDWIGREGQYDADTWALALCSRRVLNWLRHFGLLVEGANTEQTNTIARSLATQIQSLKIRAPLAREPGDAILAAVGLVGVALCDTRESRDLERRVNGLIRLVGLQTDADGMHRTRNAAMQLALLIELVNVRQALKRNHEPLADRLGLVIEPMHAALDLVTLGTGEPGYFNGCGHLPHDMLIAVQAQSGVARRRETRASGGYGLLAAGQASVLADGGFVDDPVYTANGFASGLAFEFSHGRELIVGSCGPAPSEMRENELLFRQGIAHSGICIDDVSPADIPERGPFAGRLMLRGNQQAELSVTPEDQAIFIRNHAYAAQFGVTVERRITLLAEGKTLVGQDRLVPAGGTTPSGLCSVRFHLAPGIKLYRGETEDILRLELSSGAQWTFLWEGAEMRVDESVRQSAYFGFHRTRQIVLEAEVAANPEIAWIFTLEEA